MKKIYSILSFLSVMILLLPSSDSYAQDYSMRLTNQCFTTSTQTISFTGTTPNANGAGTFTLIYYNGDLDGTGSNLENIDITGETGPSLGNSLPTGQCSSTRDSVTISIPMATINAWASTGSQIDIDLTATSAVNLTLCGTSLCVDAFLTYPVSTVPNDAGASNITPALLCAGSDSVKVQINNYGTNQIDSVMVNWSKNGVLQTPIHLKTLLDTTAGTGSTSALVNLGLHTFVSGVTDTFTVWTTMPNGVVDTTTNNDTIVSYMRPSLSGTYSIGGFSPDYANFAAAIADLSTIGVCGPVVFDVRQNIYNEQVSIGSISGSSAANSITFRSDPANTLKPVIQFAATNTANNYVLRIDNGASHIVFDSLHFKTTGTSYSIVVSIPGSSDHITINDCTLEGYNNATTSTFQSVFYQTGGLSNHNTITNNEFTDGSYGLYLRGSGTTAKSVGNVVANNSIIGANYYQTYFYYQDSLTVDNNVIEQRASSTSFTYGLYTYYCDNTKVRGNSVTLNTTSSNYGMMVGRYAGGSNEVSNNMFVTSANSTGTSYGIYDNYSLNVNIYHNSVNIRGGNPASTRALYVSGSGSTLYGNVNIRNNIFVNSVSGGYASYILSGATTGYINKIDNNIYHATGTSPFYYGTSAYPDFASYQTASSVDSNSYFGVPGFLSSSDLHLQGGLAADSGANLGIMVDIDGDVRPLLPSTGYDIGADEYIPPTCPMGYALSAFNLTATSADVTWIKGINDTAWVFEYGAPGFTPGTGTSIFSSSDTATIPGLTPITNYDVYVRGICAAGDTSLYFGPLNFKTRCVSSLSGTYTIDNSLPTAGTNYASFADVMTALNNCGVSGPTVFLVDEGTYTEQVDIKSIVGTSTTNTITFKGDPTNTSPAILTYGASSSADNFVVKFDGAEHIIFDSLTVTASGATFGYVFHFPTNADNITIENCEINGSATSTSSLATLIYNQSGTANMTNNVTINNNKLNGGGYAIYWWGGSTTTREANLVYTNNEARGFNSYGSYFYYQDSMLVEGNEFVQSTTSTSFCYGIYSYYIYDSKLSRNRVELNTTSTNYGLMLGRWAGTSNEVSNNMIITSNNSTGTAYGLYLNYCLNTNVYHNSVNVRAGSASGTRTLYVLGSTSTLYGNNDIRNNIFTNNAGGNASYINSGAASTVHLSHLDYNIYNSSGTNPFYYGTTSYPTFAAYQAASAMDSNSFFSSPGYFSQSDLHLQGVVAFDNADPSVGVSTDYDGDARPLGPTTGFDIGADEYIPPTCPSPYSMVFVDATTSSARITWTNGPADSIWEVQYGAPGFTIGTGTSMISNSDTANITGLTSSTCYDVYVRSICTVGDTSIWHGPLNFCSKCAPFADFCEGFETTNSGEIPLCWSRYINTTGTGDIRTNVSTFASYTGSNYMYMFNSNDASATMMLIAPEVSNLSAGTHRANFWLRGDSTVIVGTMSDPANPGTFTPWDTIPPAAVSTSGYSNFKVGFDTYAGTDTYVAFLWVPSRTYDYVYIDDYCWEEIPSCEKAPSVVILNPGQDSTSLNVGWNIDTTQVSFMVAYGDSNYHPVTNPAGGDTVYSTTNFKQITGLQSLTQYCVFVKAICTNGDTSFWDGPHCAPTGCPSGISLPYSEDFATYRSVFPLDETPQCWEEATGALTTSGGVAPGESLWEPDGFANVGFNGAARFNISTFGSRSGWLLTPTFNFGNDPNKARIIEFDVALTDDFNSNAPINGFGNDDTVALVVSYDQGITWKKADIIMQWDTSNEPSHTGQRVTYIMRNTTGFVKFGFYAQSNVGNEGVDFHVDNFSIYDTTWAGIEESIELADEFQVYPNPNMGVFNVLNTGMAKTSSLKLLDIQGRVVYDELISFSQKGTKQIEVENLNSGVYILLIQNEGRMEQHRVVIQ